MLARTALSAQVYDRVRKRAKAEGMTIYRFVDRALTEYLDRSNKKGSDHVSLPRSRR